MNIESRDRLLERLEANGSVMLKDEDTAFRLRDEYREGSDYSRVWVQQVQKNGRGMWRVRL